jgi:hypothetical protein
VKPKVFCIGQNKTGTTSLGAALKDLGYRVGDQTEAEKLVEDWARRDFTRLVRYCRSADAFQDVPFSLDYTYQVLHYAFPGSKFILTVRDSADVWYESLIRFHTKLLGKNHLPTPDELRAFPYHKGGWLWRIQELVYDATEESLYDRQKYVAHYERHNEQVQDYFRHRADALLILNLADSDALVRLCAFLGKPFSGGVMPHLNMS